MKGTWGFLAFLGLSVAVHAGVLVTLPQGGAAGQGAAGADTVTMTASSGAYSALIDTWDSPPQTAPQPVLAPPVPDAPTAPAMSAEPPVRRVIRPELALPMPETAPTPGPVPAPTPDLAAVPRIAVPTLALPTQPVASPAAAPDTPRPPMPGSPPGLVSPTSPQPAPEADTRPHFEGSTALAAATSPRPALRPASLAPVLQPSATPEPAAPLPSAPAPDRTAAGTGDGTSQGASATPTPQPSVSADQIQSLIGQWGGQIQGRIARSRPNVNAAGRAVVQLAVATNGQLVGLGIARSSGNAAVDQAALDAVRRAGRFPRAPRGLTDASYGFSIPLTFQ